MIDALEDAEGYKAFEAAITANYHAQSAVEQELVMRFASLLWRLQDCIVLARSQTFHRCLLAATRRCRPP